MTVDVTPFELPLREPLSTARGDIDRRRGFVVRGHVGGVEGVGEATPLPGWTEPYDDCRRALDPVDGLAAGLSSGVLDDAPAARHAVSLALFDARARSADESLGRFLAGPDAPVAEAVPVNATVGDGEEEATAETVAEAAVSGYDCAKVKVGSGSVDRDIDRLVAARERAPEIALRADANGAWSRSEAEAFADGLGEQGVSLDYLEQPLPADALDEHAALRESVDVRIAVDETLAAASVGAVLDVEAADVLVLKPMALGGPDRALAAADRAGEAGVESVVTTTIDAVVARTAAVHVAAALGDPPACGLGTAELLARDLARDPAPVVDGRVAVPDGPGIAGDAFGTLDVG
ncbi:o-succinylbenzoate synthase [Salinigranum sp. GCM10025319]|uniref:o-succinylbenzoate synthase n=1 Tax=Salinigranum sp. GCM10025319 TaxID=3252687 RepID=UPI00360B2B6E